MKYTSAEAAKLLRKLNDEYTSLLGKESRTSSFLAAMGEDVESVRPKYDYSEVQRELADLENRVRKVKHALNVFNTITVVPEFGITIDEMLVLIPQLTKRKAKLYEMKSALPKAREEVRYSRNTNVIDYRYANYDIEKAQRDYDAVSDELSRAQTALDLLNNTVTLEID